MCAYLFFVAVIGPTWSIWRSGPYSQMHSGTSKGTTYNKMLPGTTRLAKESHHRNSARTCAKRGDIRPSSLATSEMYTQKTSMHYGTTSCSRQKICSLERIGQRSNRKNNRPWNSKHPGNDGQNTLTTIAKNTVSSLWTGFMEFGTVSAAIFGILAIFKLIKTIIYIAAHGYQLRETYECGIALLGAICGSVTHPLLYLKRRRNIDDQTAQPQGISITPVVTQLPTTSTSALSELRDTISQISFGNLNSKGGDVTSRAPHAP
ncbi:uncharacterized protein LOC143304550 [Bombus vancouverensis nearcticus]|uniref:uncharacterized protein LOC143304531 n=2 Tax=Bombus vancouverensis nearcticus TaxID=2705178 RepID=UPI00402BB7F7